MPKVRSWRVLLVTMIAAVAGTLVGATPARAAGGDAMKVKTFEKFDFVPGPGGGLVLNWGFAPRTATVASGSYIRFINPNGKNGEAHTATVLNAADVPKTIDEVFACAPCNKVLARHAPQGPNGPLNSYVNSGPAGFNQAGDSRLLLPSTPILAHVTAPSGSVLHYVCAIHPWMQAKITVS
jgi:plastocyanin